MELKRQNPRSLKAIELNLKQLAGLTGKVGWFKNATYPDGTSVAYVAALNEFGHGKTPPRPSMRPTAIKNEQKWKESAATLSKQVIAGKLNGEQAMGQVCLQAQGDIQTTIGELMEPALSPVTIELRAMRQRNPQLKVTGATVGEAARRVAQPGYQTPSGVSTKPLIDTKVMFQTLTHTVEKA